MSDTKCVRFVQQVRIKCRRVPFAPKVCTLVLFIDSYCCCFSVSTNVYINQGGYGDDALHKNWESMTCHAGACNFVSKQTMLFTTKNGKGNAL